MPLAPKSHWWNWGLFSEWSDSLKTFMGFQQVRYVKPSRRWDIEVYRIMREGQTGGDAADPIN